MGKVGRPPKKRHRAANCRQLVQRNKSIVVTKWKKTAVRFGRSMVLKRWVPAPAAEYAKNLVKAAKLARPPTKLDPVLPTVRLPKELDADDEDVQAKIERLQNLAAADGLVLELRGRGNNDQNSESGSGSGGNSSTGKEGSEVAYARAH